MISFIFFLEGEESTSFKLHRSPFRNIAIILSDLVCVARLAFGIKCIVVH